MIRLVIATAAGVFGWWLALCALESNNRTLSACAMYILALTGVVTLGVGILLLTWWVLGFVTVQL